MSSSKFSPGQEVYFIENNSIKSGKIFGIVVGFKKPGKIRIYYILDPKWKIGKRTRYFIQSSLFQSPEKLAQSLVVNYKGLQKK